MKILISSHYFYPSVGGIETVTEILAGQFAAMGHSVRIVTQTRAHGEKSFPYEIYRQPSSNILWGLTKWCDIFLHNNISLNMAWPLLFIRRPWVVAHHVWISRPDGVKSWQDRLKRGLLRFAKNLSISQAIAQALPVPSVVVGDPYEEAVFIRYPRVERSRCLVYLGRLVSDKGVDLLLEAMSLLKKQGQSTSLTIIGEGDERVRLETLAANLELKACVEFVGIKRGEELVKLLNQHQILVVPSRWEEPFGIVALEGIACGCLVIGSQRGGLLDAIGPCGLTFPNGDVEALAQGIRTALNDSDLKESAHKAAAAHLQRFTRQSVAERYLAVMESALSS